MRYLGGDEPRYPEVGKYETDEETGKPIEVPEEASSAGGKGKGNGMAKALENFGKSMCDGLKSFGRASTSAGEKSKYEKLILIRDVVSDREGAVKTDEMRIEIEALVRLQKGFVCVVFFLIHFFDVLILDLILSPSSFSLYRTNQKRYSMPKNASRMRRRSRHFGGFQRRTEKQ